MGLGKLSLGMDPISSRVPVSRISNWGWVDCSLQNGTRRSIEPLLLNFSTGRKSRGYLEKKILNKVLIKVMDIQFA